jgi:predicted phosphodiesterase
MRIGVVSDPHGCLVGLKATLDWLENEGIDTIVCAGDMANFGPQPNECISLLIERNVASVQGNCDRDILLPLPTDQYTDERANQLNEIDACAVLEQQPKGWKASIHRIPFDLEAAAQAIRKANMPYTERLILTQKKACWW